MKYLKIHDWENNQTYRKDRGTPPWIKVYRNIFSNHKWALLSDSEKGQLVSMWVLAADKNGLIPDDSVLLQKLCMLDSKINLNKFKDLGLLTSDGCQLDANLTPECQPLDAPETETETETETEYSESFEKLWDSWNPYEMRKGSKSEAKKKYLKAVKSIDSELILEKALAYCKCCSAEKSKTKHVVTWINQQGWLDDYTEEQPKKKYRTKSGIEYNHFSELSPTEQARLII